jgi:hypothetical protein
VPLPFTASTKPPPAPPLPLSFPHTHLNLNYHAASTAVSLQQSLSPTPLLLSSTTIRRPASRLAARHIYQEKSSSTQHNTCGSRSQRRIVQERSLSFLSCQSIYPGERCGLLPVDEAGLLQCLEVTRSLLLFFTVVLGREVLVADPEDANSKTLEAEFGTAYHSLFASVCKVWCCELTIPPTCVVTTGYFPRMRFVWPTSIVVQVMPVPSCTGALSTSSLRCSPPESEIRLAGCTGASNRLSKQG